MCFLYRYRLWLIKNLFAVTLAAIAWTSIGLQYFTTDITLVNFFSYFTILSNLLIAVCLTFSLSLPKTSLGKYFSSLSVQSATATYIFIVGLVYNLVLRGIMKLTGLAWMLDNMVHVVVPVLYIIYWALFRPKGVLKYLDGVYWILFPFVYLLYSMLRGAATGWYPYPFLNAIKLGYGSAILNICLMIIVFFLTGMAVIRITRFSGKS